MVRFNLQIPNSFTSGGFGSHGSLVSKAFVMLFRSVLHIYHCDNLSVVPVTQVFINNFMEQLS